MNPDIIKEAMQTRVTQVVRDGQCIVTHYVAVMGITQFNEDGSVTSAAIMAMPDGQARYIASGLLQEAAILMSEVEDCFDEEVE